MNQIIYISSPESQQIYVWKLDNIKKKLELIQIVCTPGNIQPIAIHPNRQFLYAGTRPNFGIITYHINLDGSLNIIKITEISSSPTYLIVNTTGTFLYCASYKYNIINVIKINKLGIPNVIVQIIKNLAGCHSVNIDKNKKLLWAPCLQEHSIRLFTIHPTNGMLALNNPDRIVTKTGSGPRHMTFHKSSNYSYLINELDGTINVIKYNSENEIFTIIQTISILPDNQKSQQFWAADIHITPNNHWLYCTDRFSHTISCFQICAKTKTLKFIYFQYTETQPRAFAIDITGKFIIVAGQKSHYITLYQININNGKLNTISRYSSGIGPTWVNINPIYSSSYLEKKIKKPII